MSILHCRAPAVDAFFGYLFHNRNYYATEAVESMFYTCSSGRDKSSIQACSNSGDIVCGVGGGISGPVERVTAGRAGCSGDMMVLLLLLDGETAVVFRQTEVLYETNKYIC